MIDELYRRHYGALLAYCTAMTRERAAAEDLVHETYLRAMTHVDDLEDLSASQRSAWLKKTARNLFLDGCRKAARIADGEAEPSRWDDYSAPELLDACGRLPPEERALFILRYVEGYNATELGERFNLPPSTVRARLASARRKMQKLYFEGD